MANRIYKLFFFLIIGLSLSAQNCDAPVALSDDCASAPIFCGETLDNYCSSTGVPNTFNPSIANGCNLENSIWVQIPVCQSEVNLSILVNNCQLGLGLNVMLAGSADCQNFSAESPGCISLNPNSQTAVQFSNLTPDELYYLIFDGNISDLCDFTIEVIDGIAGLDTIPPDTTSTTPYMWNVITPAYIEGEANACLSNGQYRLVPAVCELVPGNCLGGGSDSRSRMAGCDIPTELCPIPTQFDTIVHWNIPPCIEIIGDSTSLDIQLDFSNYIQCYIQSGMQPWPIDTIPFSISADLELIPIPDTTNSDNIFCDCQGIVGQICNSCPSGAGLDGGMPTNLIYEFFEMCPPCGDTPYGNLCVWDQLIQYPDPCTVIIVEIFPLPDDPIDFGTFNIDCNGNCISVDTETFCGGGFYTWQTTNQFGCIVDASAEVLEPNAIALSGTSATLTCNSPTATISVNASGGTGTFTYSWGGPDLIVSSGGTYTCIVTDQNGCTESIDLIVTEDFYFPSIHLIAIPSDTLDDVVTSIDLMEVGTFGLQFYYSWEDPQNNFIASNAPLISITEPGIYSLTVTDPNNGCYSIGSIEIFDNSSPQGAPFILGDSCTYAPYFCAEFLDGATSNNQNATADNLDLIPGCPMDNALWLSFSPCETTAELSFFVDSCLQAQGLEFSIVSSEDCDSFNVVGTPCQTVANGNLDTLTFDSLEIGNIYYLIIDGISADICDFEIGVIGGIAGGLDSIPPPDSLDQYHLEQIVDASIDGPTPVCAFTQNTYTFTPGICAIVEGDCNRVQGIPASRAAAPCDNGCFNNYNVELDTIVDWTVPDGTIIHGDSTGFDITLEFGLDFILDQYNGMIPTSDTDTIVITLMADYSIVPINDTITQDSLGAIYCYCPIGTICGSCVDSASFDVEVIIIFDEDARTTCIDVCEDACGQQICPGESVYCTIPCVLTTVTLTLEPIDQINYTDFLDCFVNCVSTPYGDFCAPGIYIVNEPCAIITVEIIFQDGNHTNYPPETICPGQCVTVGTETFCAAGNYFWDDPFNCDTYSVEVMEFAPFPIDYGFIVLCPNECFTANDGQQICTPGTHNFTEIDPDGCEIDATVTIDFSPDVNLGTIFICDGECYDSPLGPICVPGNYNWPELQNGCMVTVFASIQFFNTTPIDYGTVTICPNTCFTSNDGQQFCTPGVHNFSEIDQNGCTVNATVNIQFSNVSDVDLGTVFVCDGDCYNSSNGPLCTPGPHTWTEMQNGCTVNFTVDVQFFTITPPIDYGTVTLCPNECFTSNDGQIFCTAGVQNFTEIDQNGCNVNATVDLQFFITTPIDYGTVALCPGDCFTANDGQQFCTAGVHNFTEIDQNGCNVNATLDLQFFTTTPIDYGTVALCPGDCFTANDGQQFCTAGVHNFTETDQNGCNVNATLDLQFFTTTPIDYGTVALCPGDCFTTNDGQQFCTAGVHNFTETDQNGCTVDAMVDIQFFTTTPIDYGIVNLCINDCFTANDGQQFCTAGVHNFTETDQNGCLVNATVEIIIESPAALSIGNLSEICSPSSDEYTVSFTIYGDQPFLVNGIEIAGDFYTSPNYSSGSSYSFEVKNSQALCPSTEFINGSYSCPLLCTSDAGALINTPNNLCTSQALNINEIDPVVLQNADFDFEYLLHTDPDPLTGSVLMRNKTGIFNYNASILVVETDYFTSRVVGMVVNNEVDLSGNCLEFTSGPSIKYYADPMLSIVSNNDLILDCNQSTIDLSAQASGGSGQWDFSWTGGATSTAESLTADQAGGYNCMIIDQITGCEAQALVNIDDNFIYPTAAILAPQGMINCTVKELELVADVWPLDGTVDMQWTGPNGLITTADPLALMVNQAGWYQLNLSHSESGCTDEVSVEVMENQDVPTAIQMVLEQPECFDEPLGSLNIIDVEGGSGPYEFYFENEITDGQVNNLPAGDYTVSVVDQNGCELIQAIEILAPETYETDLEAIININYGETVQLDAQLNFEPYLITWLDAAGNTLSNAEVLNMDIFDSQRISLHAVDQNGCAIETDVQLLVKALEPVIYVPNAFSPNGDKFNDEFEIFGNETIAKIDVLRIFDRWGSLVFVAENYILGADKGKWDGRTFGKKLNPGVFIYETTFTLLDGQKSQKTGDVVLLK